MQCGVVRGGEVEGGGVTGREKWCQCVWGLVKSVSASDKMSSSDPTPASPFRLHWSGYSLISCNVCVYRYLLGNLDCISWFIILCYFSRANHIMTTNLNK